MKVELTDELYYLRLYLKGYLLKQNSNNLIVFEKKHKNEFTYVILKDSIFYSDEHYSFESYESFKRKLKIKELNII